MPTGDVARDLPSLPGLFFSGERDLSMPLAWAQGRGRQGTDGRLVAVAGAGHSVQLRAKDPSVRQILGRFLGG